MQSQSRSEGSARLCVVANYNIRMQLFELFLELVNSDAQSPKPLLHSLRYAIQYLSEMTERTLLSSNYDFWISVSYIHISKEFIFVDILVENEVEWNFYYVYY